MEDAQGLEGAYSLIASLERLLLAPFGNETCSCYFVVYVKFVDGFWGIVCRIPQTGVPTQSSTKCSFC